MPEAGGSKPRLFLAGTPEDLGFSEHGQSRMDVDKVGWQDAVTTVIRMIFNDEFPPESVGSEWINSVLYCYDVGKKDEVFTKLLRGSRDSYAEDGTLVYHEAEAKKLFALYPPVETYAIPPRHASSERKRFTAIVKIVSKDNQLRERLRERLMEMMGML